MRYSLNVFGMHNSENAGWPQNCIFIVLNVPLLSYCEIFTKGLGVHNIENSGWHQNCFFIGLNLLLLGHCEIFSKDLEMHNSEIMSGPKTSFL